MKKIVLMAFVLLAVVSCNKKDNAAKTNEKPQVKVAAVTQQNVPQTEVYTATVESDVKNNISPNMAQRISRIYVDVGDHVAKGQLLVQLDGANQNQLKLQLQSAQAQLQNQIVEFNRTS